MISSAVAAAAEEFARTLKNLGISEPDDPASFGRRAALLAAAEKVWTQHLGELIDSRAVQDMLQITRQAVSDHVRRGRLLAIKGSTGQLRFPAFQFHPGVRKLVPEVLRVFRDKDVSPSTIASWFCSPQPALKNRTPVAWLERRGAKEPVLQAARRTAARLAH